MFSVVLKSECGTAKFSLPFFVLFSCCSRYVVFVGLIHIDDHIVRRLATLPICDQSEAEKLSQTDTPQRIENRHTGRCCSPSSACKNECIANPFSSGWQILLNPPAIPSTNRQHQSQDSIQSCSSSSSVTDAMSVNPRNKSSPSESTQH